MQDEERTKRALNVVPTLEELNAATARTPEELTLFNRLDHEWDWPVLTGAPSCARAFAWRCINTHAFGVWHQSTIYLCEFDTISLIKGQCLQVSRWLTTCQVSAVGVDGRGCYGV